MRKTWRLSHGVHDLPEESRHGRKSPSWYCSGQKRQQSTIASSWEHPASLLGRGHVWVESWRVRKGFGPAKVG